MTRPASPPSPRPARKTGAWRLPLRTCSLLPLLALCVASPLAVVSLLGASAVAGQPTTFGVPPGVSDDGRSVPVAALAGASAPAHGLQLRRGCRWGQPGRLPYQGSTRQALVAAGLPEEVVAQIEAQRNAGQKSGRLAIGRDGIRHTGDGRVFPAKGFALSFGMTLCLDASVNFAKGHVEMADLYEARDAQGRPHAVMVPDVCGNVSVLAMPGQQGRVAGLAATLARRGQALAALADALDPPARARPGTALVAGPGVAPAAATPADGAGAGGGEDGADGADGADADAAAGAKAALAGQAGRNRVAGAAGLPGAPSDPQPGSRPAVLATVGMVTGLLLPQQVSAGMVRGLGRVTAAAGRELESLGGSGGGGSGGGAGGTPAAVAGGGNTQSVPEPGSLWLGLLALAALAVARRR